MNDNTKGSVFMAVSMALFTMEDSLVKYLEPQMGLGPLLVTLGLCGVLVFSAIAKKHGENILHPALFSRTVGLRAICELCGRLFFTLAFVYSSLASTSAILMATPLLVSIGAALFFHEKIGPRRWAAIGAGFLGVLLIIRPGMDSFSPTSILALIGTLGFAGRDLANRAVPASLSHRILGVYGFSVLALSGIIIGIMLPSEPAQFSWEQLLFLAATAFFSISAYYILTIATRVGDISISSPFRYTRLLFAMAMAFTLFNERPDSIAITGSIIIVISGIYLLVCTRQKRVKPLE